MHTSDLFHKQPWSDGLVNIYDQLGVDYYENKHRWVLISDGGPDGAADLAQAKKDNKQISLDDEDRDLGQSQRPGTFEHANSPLGRLLGSTGSDQEYANARAAQAALEAGLPTFVDTRGMTRDVRDNLSMPHDNLSLAIKDFNENPSIGLSTLGALASLTGVGAVPAAAIGVAGKMAGVPDLVTVDREGPKSPIFDALKKEVTGKADGGPIVPQGGIASLAYYDDGGPVEGGRGTPYERKEIEDLTKTYRSDGRGGMYEVDPNEELMMEDVPVPRRLKDTVSQIIYALEMMQRVPYDRRPYDENINLTAPYRYFGGKDQRPADPQPYEMMPKELNGR